MAVHAKVHLTIEARFRCDLLSGVFWTISNFQVYRCIRMVQIQRLGTWKRETKSRRVGGEVLTFLQRFSLPSPHTPLTYKLHAARRIQIAAFNNASNAMNHGTTKRFRRQPVLRVYRQVTEPVLRNIYNPSMEI